MDNKDLDRLINKMKGMVEGDFSYAKEGEYDDPEVAKVFNEMVNSIMHRNNLYLVRINDAMTRIADNSCVKTMLDEIEKQSAPIKTLQVSTDIIQASRDSSENGGARIYALVKQVEMAMVDIATQCDELVIKMNEYRTNKSDDKEADDALLDMMSEVTFLQDDLMSVSVRVEDMVTDISVMYHDLDRQNEVYKNLFEAMASVSDSFARLYTDCLNVGGHLYRISRDIDNARNDMYRKNSWPLLHDKLKVFAVDHLTLAWRLYNHAMEYETLKITQMNNPDGCKFGIWAKNEMDRGSDFSKVPAFQRMVEAHYEFHDHAVSCFLLKESFKDKEALAEFQEALNANSRFAEAIDEMHKYLNSIGIADETEVWKFEELNNVRTKL